MLNCFFYPKTWFISISKWRILLSNPRPFWWQSSLLLCLQDWSVSGLTSYSYLVLHGTLVEGNLHLNIFVYICFASMMLNVVRIFYFKFLRPVFAVCQCLGVRAEILSMGRGSKVRYRYKSKPGNFGQNENFNGAKGGQWCRVVSRAGLFGSGSGLKLTKFRA